MLKSHGQCEQTFWLVMEAAPLNGCETKNSSNEFSYTKPDIYFYFLFFFFHINFFLYPCLGGVEVLPSWVIKCLICFPRGACLGDFQIQNLVIIMWGHCGVLKSCYRVSWFDFKAIESSKPGEFGRGSHGLIWLGVYSDKVDSAKSWSSKSKRFDWD